MSTLNETLDAKLDNVLNEKAVDANKAYIAGMSISAFMDYVHGENNPDGANDKYIYDKMLQDGTVSNIINAYMADLVVRDKITNHVCNVLSDDVDLVEELSDFLYNQVKIDDNLYSIALRCFCYGCGPVELCSIDTVTDKQWELYIEKELKKCKGSNLTENLKNFNIKDSLKEDVLNITKKGIKKRWYINLLSAWRLQSIETKGKVLAYINPDNTEKIYDGSTLVAFMNKSVTSTTTVSNDDESDSYTITDSESFLKNAKTAYTVLSAFEDLLLIHALTTSINYRIFQVDVGTLGDEETVKLIQDIKKRINENESFDVENSFYSSSMTGVPMGASIIIPTRNGIGTLSVQQIDNNFGTDQLGDFNYFKDKLANALMANPAILGNSTNNNGALATGAATETLDDRAHQFIEKYRILLASNIENLCDLYLQQTRSKKAYNEIPDYSIRISKNTSRDQVKYLEAQENAAQSLQQVLRALDEAGIKLDQYPDTRIQLFRQFLGDELADTLADEYKKNKDNGEELPSDLDDEDFNDLGGSDNDLEVNIDNEVSSEEDMNTPIEEPGVEVQ